MYHKLLPIICALLISTAARSQQSTDSLPPVADSSNKIYSRVEVEAQFPGGNPAWRLYLRKRLDPLVPIRNNAPAGHYEAVVRFIVSKDGSISKVVAETDHGYGMEDELKSVIRRGPKWIPATLNGVPVNAYRRQPCTFVISGRN